VPREDDCASKVRFIGQKAELCTDIVGLPGLERFSTKKKDETTVI
jgi:hypothetical protein